MSQASLSLRGQAASQIGSDAGVWDIIANLYHPTTNPTGYVSLGLAENSLMHAELASYIERSLTSIPHPALTYGDGATGSHNLKAVVARFLTKHLKPCLPIEAGHVSVTNGVSTVLEGLSWAIANPGEGFLLGRPYYRAFLNDFQLRPGAKIVPVSFLDPLSGRGDGEDGESDPFGVGCISYYEKALLEAEASGTKVRGLILCHPHNPLGRCYSRETLVELMRFCGKYEIHFISDEIYALSVWENTVDYATQSPTPFISALSIPLASPNVPASAASSITSPPTSPTIPPHLLHLTWGLSKDFGANGLRLGILISQSNPHLLRVFNTLGLYTYASSLSDLLATRLLSEENGDWVDGYIKENQRRLGDAYRYVTGELEREGIRYVKGATAAFFVWCDLGSAFVERGGEGRRRVTWCVDEAKEEGSKDRSEPADATAGSKGQPEGTLTDVESGHKDANHKAINGTVHSPHPVMAAAAAKDGDAVTVTPWNGTTITTTTRLPPAQNHNTTTTSTSTPTGRPKLREGFTAYLYRRLLANKIFICGGDVTGAEEEGWFRIVFSQDRELVGLGIRRIVEVLDGVDETEDGKEEREGDEVKPWGAG